MMFGVLTFQRGHALVETFDLLTQFCRLLLFRDNRVSHLSQLGVAFLWGHLAHLLGFTQIGDPGGEHRVVDDREVQQHQEHQGSEDDRRSSVNTLLA